MEDVDELVGIENEQLVATLEGLDEERWNAPSLCAGWRVRDVAVHLLMPYELSVPGFLLRTVRSRFDFDAVADRLATGDTRSHAAVVAALRTLPGRRFNVPGSPPEAPLSHLVIHAGDIRGPLGLAGGSTAASALRVLGQQTAPRFRSRLPANLLDGLTYTATDVAWSFGEERGVPEVRATASALIMTFAGRTAALDELTGDGADEVRRRLR